MVQQDTPPSRVFTGLSSGCRVSRFTSVFATCSHQDRVVSSTPCHSYSESCAHFCLFWCTISFARDLQTCGWNWRRWFVAGSRVFVLRLIRCWPWLDPIPCVGVFQKSKIAKQGLAPASHTLRRSSFAVFTADSPLPFAALPFPRLIIVSSSPLLTMDW